jgi:hypothetical protein
MSATIPLPLRSQDITVVTLTAQDADAATGVLGDRGTSVTCSILAVLEDMDADETVEHEDFGAITSKRLNMVAGASGMRIRVSEIPGRVAAHATASTFTAGAPKLAQFRRSVSPLSGAQPFVKLEWTEAGTAYVYYGSFAGYSAPRRGRGKQLASISLEPVDIGGANPTTAGAA